MVVIGSVKRRSIPDRENTPLPVDTAAFSMINAKSTPAAEQTGDSTPVTKLPGSESSSWRRRHQRKKRLHVEGIVPASSVCPKELLYSAADYGEEVRHRAIARV